MDTPRMVYVEGKPVPRQVPLFEELEDGALIPYEDEE